MSNRVMCSLFFSYLGLLGVHIWMVSQDKVFSQELPSNTTTYASYFISVTQDAVNLTNAFQSEIELWQEGQTSNKQMADLTEIYLGNFTEQLFSFNSTVSPERFKDAKDNLARSFYNEIKSYEYFRDYLLSGNESLNEISTDYLGKSLDDEAIAFKAFENATFMEQSAPSSKDTYLFVREWGSGGSNEGQFLMLRTITLDSHNNLYTADVLNGVQKFDSEGNFLSKWNSYKIPKSEGVYTGPESNFKEETKVMSPIDIAIDSLDNTYVTDYYQNMTLKFDSEGNFLTKWGSEGSKFYGFNLPGGIAIDSKDNVYVSDVFNHNVQKFDSEGNFLSTFGTNGTENGQFNLPSELAIDSEDNVYVADYGNNRVQKFDSEGNFLSTFGTNGTENGQFDGPAGITTDSNDNLYVTDYGNNRVQKFDSEGNFLTKWGSEGLGKRMFQAVGGIAVDLYGYVYVVDSGNNRIQVFEPIDSEVLSNQYNNNIEIHEIPDNGTSIINGTLSSSKLTFGITDEL